VSPGIPSAVSSDGKLTLIGSQVGSPVAKVGAIAAALNLRHDTFVPPLDDEINE